MIYTVIAENGHSYDLPSKTLSVMDKLERILKIDSEKGLTIKQKYQKIFDFAVDLLGKDNVSEILGSGSINEIDVGELELLVLKISDAYNASIAEYQAEKIRSSLDSIPSEKLSAITDAMKAIK